MTGIWAPHDLRDRGVDLGHRGDRLLGVDLARAPAHILVRRAVGGLGGGLGHQPFSICIEYRLHTFPKNSAYRDCRRQRR